MSRRSFCWAFVTVLFAAPAFAQFDSGSDGSDGAFNPLTNVTVDLSLAGGGPGTGTYDADKWAVIFNYTTIDVPSGVTVTFANHPSGAPLVWLAQSDVTIDGTVNLNGGAGSSGAASYAPGGPGGFSGGLKVDGGVSASGGFGPGGGAAGAAGAVISGAGSYATSGGGFAGPTYGNEQIVPLIGGSGGGGSTGNGGGGGGAILIACSSQITLDGSISASGGTTNGAGAGSGGAIRLMAPLITGNGSLSAKGSSPSGFAGGDGRIRMEADTFTFTGGTNPTASCHSPGTVFPQSPAPTLRVTQIAGQPLPADPQAGPLTIDHFMADEEPVQVVVEAMNIPPGTPVTLRIIPERGPIVTVAGGSLVGSLALSIATADISLPLCRFEIQARANWTP